MTSGLEERLFLIEMVAIILQASLAEVLYVLIDAEKASCSIVWYFLWRKAINRDGPNEKYRKGISWWWGEVVLNKSYWAEVALIIKRETLKYNELNGS